MARWLLSILFLAVILAPVAATTVDFKVIPVKNEIEWNDTAIYKLEIYNHGPGDNFLIRSANLNWGFVRANPAIIPIAGNGFSETEIKISPPADVRVGSYIIEILAVAESDKSVKGTALVKINVISEFPKIETEWGIPKKIVPGEPIDVNLIFKNTGNTEVRDINAVLSSPLLSEDISFKINSLKPGQASLVWNSQLKVKSDTEPKNYDFEIKFYDKGNNLILKDKFSAEVVKKQVVNVKVEKKGSFLGTGYFVLIKNIGNTEAIDFYKIQLPSWQRLFLQSKYKPLVQKTENFVEVAWPYNIPKGEVKLITYQISYVPLLALILGLLLICYAGSLYFKQELVITKDVLRSEKALKVLVKAKNSSNRPIQNVVLIDSIPTPLKLSKQPSIAKIKKEEGVAKLLWKYEVLWPGEEKTIEYEIKSALNIIGSVILPPAKGKYKTGDNLKTFASNSVVVRSRPSSITEEEEE